MHIRYARIAGVALSIAFVLTAAAPSHARQSPARQSPNNDESTSFTGAVAESLMRQIRDGLVARNSATVLAAFDPDNMPDYNGFADQLRAFLDQWDNVRVYYQIVNTAESPSNSKCGAAGCGMATVQFQMDGENALGQGPAMHREAQLQLTFQRGDKGWKIVNLAPRDLFQ